MKLTLLKFKMLTIGDYLIVPLYAHWFPGAPDRQERADCRRTGACRRNAGGAAGKRAQAAAGEEYVLKGEVRKVEKEAREVTIGTRRFPASWKR